MIDKVKELAIQAGKKIMELRDESLAAVNFKQDESPVTAADLASNSLIVEGLTKLAVAPVVSEEGILPSPSDDFWLVDPLDGTKDFVAGKPSFIVNIALIKNRQPVLGVLYAPMTEELFWAEEGSGAYKSVTGSTSERIFNANDSSHLKVLASGSHMAARMREFLESLPLDSLERYGSALKMCRIAEGVADLYPRMGPTHEWDTAAGHVVLNEAGCKLLDVVTGEDLKYGKPGFLNGSFVVARKDIDILPQLRKLRERWLAEKGN